MRTKFAVPAHVAAVFVCLLLIGLSAQEALKLPVLSLTPDSRYHVADCPELLKATRPPQTAELNVAVAGWNPCPICHPEESPAVLAALKAAGLGPEELRAGIPRARSAVNKVINAMREVELAARASEAAARKSADDAARAEAAKAIEARIATPLVRPTIAQLLSLAKDAEKTANGDKDVFIRALERSIQKTNPDYRYLDPDQLIGSRDGTSVMLLPPVHAFHLAAAEAVRKMEAMPSTLTTSVEIIVSPEKIDGADIERIVVKRNGVVIAPLSSTLAPKSFTTRMGAKTILHAGSVRYPLSAFAPGPGVTVTVTAIAAAGDNIAASLTGLALRNVY